MDRRQFLRYSAAATASAALPGLALGKDREDRPNIVLIFMDDLGWKDVGYMGSEYYETPNIDRLAGQGMVFTDAYTNAPNCAPTRACLMSGQYGPRHGIYTVGSSKRGKSKDRKLIPIENTTQLPGDTVTIAEDLKRAGYATAMLGKWHLGGDPGPEGQGFDVVATRNEAGFRKYWRDKKNGSGREYLTDWLTDKAIDFMDENSDRPFFLYLSHHAVHKPLRAKQELIEKYKEKPGSHGQNNPTYAAMIESSDQSVGRVLDKLDEMGVADNTFVMFYSDNGGYGGYQKWGIKKDEITSQAPLRGGKGMLYEGGIRVPMAVRWPGVVEPGSTCDTPVTSIDLFPTFQDVAGLQKRPDHVLDGESMVPLLDQIGGLERDAIFWHSPVYLQANKGTFRTRPGGAIRMGEYKLHEYFEDGHLELYNLADDIGERHNLVDEMPQKTRELHRRMKQWRRSVDAPVPTKLNPDYKPD